MSEIPSKDAALPGDSENSVLELEKFRCSKCSKYLSRFPIYIHGEQTICGRCEVPEGSTRSKTCERFIEEVAFPCHNEDNGCLQVLVPGEIREHELKCVYNQYQCPFEFGSTNLCPKISIDNFKLHLAQEHKSKVLHNWSFPLNFTHKYDMKFVMLFESSIFVVLKLCKNEYEYNIGVGLFGPKYVPEKYWFKLELFSKETSEKMVFADKPVHHYNDKTVKEEAYFVKVEEKEITKNFSEFFSLVCNIQLINRNLAKENSLECEREKESLNSDEKFLSEIECPVCLGHMRPPIYLCRNGHSVCSSCKQQVRKCPTCRSDMLANSRNFYLEKLSGKLQHNCANHEYGCPYFGLLNSLLEHERTCKFEPYVCPLWEHTQPECSWKGAITDILQHVQSNHFEALIRNDILLIDYPNTKQLNQKTGKGCAVLQKFGKVFRILYYWWNTNFYCCIQRIGPKQISEEFTYTLELFKNSKVKKMFTKHTITPFQRETDAHYVNIWFFQTSDESLRTVYYNHVFYAFRLLLEMRQKCISI